MHENFELKRRLLEVAKEKEALLFGEFNLSAGGTSNYYFDGRILTLDPEGAYLTAKILLPLVLDCGAEAIAGPTLGADPIVSSVASLSYIEETNVPALIVRKEAKSHGGMKSVEGSLRKGMKVAVVDDTCTSGSSIFHAVNVLEEEGCEVVKIFSVMDRMAGGSDECRRRGYGFESIFIANLDGEIVIVS
mgnify:FL=1